MLLQRLAVADRLGQAGGRGNRVWIAAGFARRCERRASRRFGVPDFAGRLVGESRRALVIARFAAAALVGPRLARLVEAVSAADVGPLLAGLRVALAAAIPIARLDTEMMPSFAPSTAARSQLLRCM